MQNPKNQICTDYCVKASSTLQFKTGHVNGHYPRAHYCEEKWYCQPPPAGRVEIKRCELTVCAGGPLCPSVGPLCCPSRASPGPDPQSHTHHTISHWLNLLYPTDWTRTHTSTLSHWARITPTFLHYIGLHWPVHCAICIANPSHAFTLQGNHPKPAP